MNDTEALRVNRKSKVDTFCDAFSYLHSHNPLNEAYHKAGMSWFVPMYSLRWRIPLCLVPKKVRRHVDADSVVSGIWKKLRVARALIERERLSLDREVERPVQSKGQSYDNLPADLVFSHKTIGGKPAVAYAFNPYRLALAMIKEYELYIGDVMMSQMLPFAQLSLICQKARSLETWVNMVTGAML